jgi:hypothetical protein
MKKVIPNTPKNTITLAKVLKQSSPLIGFTTNSHNKDKVILVPESYNSKLYLARCFHSWEKGNGYSPEHEASATIQKWEEFFRKNHNAEMFIFDSAKELFNWFAE